jgi:hypothetical protein
MTPKELKAAVQKEVDAGTTPTLHFLTARAYHASARSIMLSPLPQREYGHADAPIRALFHHAAELYLKAYLLHAGVAAAQLRSHNYERLVNEAQQRRLGLAAEFMDDLRALEALGAFGSARYQSLGTRSAGIEPERLNALCNALAPLVALPIWGTIPLARSHIIKPL